MTTTMINSKQRSDTLRMALGVGAVFLPVMLVLGVLGQWASAITLVVATMFFSFLALTGHQLNRALLEDSPLPLTFPGSPPLPLSLFGGRAGQGRMERAEEAFKPFVFQDGEGPEVPERKHLAA